MFDPISIGLAFLLSMTKDALQSEVAKAMFSGIIGNRADHYFTKGLDKIKDIVNLRNSKYPENHDLLRTLRMSMLKATEMLYLSMKEDEEEKQFRKKLKTWMDEQIKNLPILSKWIDWENPASGKLELFFTSESTNDEKKKLLIEKMIFSWAKYIESQLMISLPQAFTTKLNQGWLENDKRIFWHEATMVIMIETLRNPNNEQSIKASKAFEHNFLSDIKLQISDIHELLLSQFANNETIVKLADTITSQQKTIEAQAEVNQWLTQQLSEHKIKIEVLELQVQTNPLKDKELKELIKQRDELLSNNNFLVEKESQSLLEKRDIEKKYLSIILPKEGLDNVPKEAKREKAEFAFKLGKIELKNLNHSKGIELLREAVSLYPENYDYKIELGVALNEIGESNEAWNVISVYYNEKFEAINPTTRIKISNLAAAIGISFSDFKAAKVHLEHALGVHFEQYGKVVYQGAEVIMHNLSSVCEELGEHEEAVYYSKLSLAATVMITGKRSYESVITWASYANLLLNIGNTVSAGRILKYCITLFDRHKIKIDKSYSRLYFLLSRKFKIERNYDQALSMISKSYEILSIIYGENSLRLIPAIKLKSSIFHSQFNSQAELDEEMKIYRIIQGPTRYVDRFNTGMFSPSHELHERNKEDFIECSIKIADCLFNLERYESIPNYLQLAYNYLIITKEENTLLAAFLLGQIGLAYYESKNDDKAIEYSTNALEKYKDLKFKSQDNSVIDQNIEAIENNLANAWLSKCDFKKAIHHYENSIEILKGKFSNQTERLINALNNLGSALREDHQFQKAIEIKHEALELSKNILGVNHDTTNTISKGIELTTKKMEDFKALNHDEGNS